MHTQDKEILENAYRSYAPKISFPPYTALSGAQVVVDYLGRARPEAKGRSAQEFANEEIPRGAGKIRLLEIPARKVVVPPSRLVLNRLTFFLYTEDQGKNLIIYLGNPTACDFQFSP